MSSLLTAPGSVHPAIPANSDGLLVPRLIPVAAHLCAEDYPDESRSRVLEQLADGVSPRACCLIGSLEWSDLAEVERLLGRRPAPAPRRPDGSIDPDPELTAWLAEPVRTPGVALPFDLAVAGDRARAIPRPDPFRLDWSADAIEAADRLLCPYPPDRD